MVNDGPLVWLALLPRNCADQQKVVPFCDKTAGSLIDIADDGLPFYITFIRLARLSPGARMVALKTESRKHKQTIRPVRRSAKPPLARANAM